MTRSFRARCALCGWTVVSANPEARHAEFMRHYQANHAKPEEKR